MSKKHDPYEVAYRCSFACGKTLSRALVFDGDSFELLQTPPEPWPEWTKMERHRCPSCSLDLAKHPHCPAALQLIPVVEECHDIESFVQTELCVTTVERTVTHTTTAQRALSSLMGLIMAASGCPLLEPFRLMSRFHLPVSTDDETMYRAISMYLMSRLINHRKGKTSGLELNGLLRIYRNVERLNKAMASRLSPVCKNDAIINGLIRLNQYAQMMPLSLEEYLDRLNPLFAAYGSETQPA